MGRNRSYGSPTTKYGNILRNCKRQSMNCERKEVMVEFGTKCKVSIGITSFLSKRITSFKRSSSFKRNSSFKRSSSFKRTPFHRLAMEMA